MARDFITLQCPSCGGKLKFSPGTLAITCDHCSTEHIVRKAADGYSLESFARCPQCGRNDRAEKITAIQKSQSHNVSGITYQTISKTVKVGKQQIPVTEQIPVPVQTYERSELASLLDPPLPPIPPEKPKPTKSNLATSFAGILLAFGLVTACPACMVAILAFDTSQEEVGTYIMTIGLLGTLAFLSIAAATSLFIWVVPKERGRNEEKKVLFQEQMESYESTVQRQGEEYSLSKELWAKTYYCGRDDCVFLPGTGTFAPVGELQDYIFSLVHSSDTVKLPL